MATVPSAPATTAQRGRDDGACRPGSRATSTCRRTTRANAEAQPTRAARRREDVRSDRLETNCGALHDPARPEARRRTRPRRSSSLGRERLLRRHHLPPDRARLRDPGRRPDRERARGGPGYTTVDTAAERRAVHARRRRDGEVGRRAAGHGRQPVLRRHRRGRGPAARLRDRRQGHRRASTSSSGSGKLGDAATEQPTQTSSSIA